MSLFLVQRPADCVHEASRVFYAGDYVGLLYAADERGVMLQTAPARYVTLGTVDAPAPFSGEHRWYPTEADALAALGNPEVVS